MNWTEMEQLITLRRYDCDYCGVKRGEWCKTKSGNRATWMHAIRSQEIRTYSWMVYEEGEKAGAFFTERRMQREIDQLKQALREMRLTYA